MSVLAVLVASFLGSLHCVAMCGGLAGFCANSSQRFFAGTVAYHLGRGFSYTLLGAAAGALGGQIDVQAQLLGFERITSIAIGLLLLVWGVVALYSGRAPKIFQKVVGLVSSRIAGRLKRAKERDYSALHIGALTGLLTVFLPCGWLYAFVLVAVASGSALSGAGVMLFFWMGSVPLLFVCSFGIKLLRPSMLRWAPRLGALLLVFAGLSSVFARENLSQVLAHQHQKTSGKHEAHHSPEQPEVFCGAEGLGDSRQQRSLK